MKVVIDISEDRYADIQRIASVQLLRRWPTPEQIIAKGVTINEPRQGKWIEIKHTFLHKCSECDWINYHDSGYKFCPDCGADMRGEQE